MRQLVLLCVALLAGAGMTDPQAKMVCGRAVSYSESKLGWGACRS